jgi:hypothetical protein
MQLRIKPARFSPRMITALVVYGTIAGLVAYLRFVAHRLALQGEPVAPEQPLVNPMYAALHAGNFAGFVNPKKAYLDGCYNESWDVASLSARLRTRRPENLIPVVRALRAYKELVVRGAPAHVIDELEDVVFPWMKDRSCGLRCLRAKWKGPA